MGSSVLLYGRSFVAGNNTSIIETLFANTAIRCRQPPAKSLTSALV